MRGDLTRSLLVAAVLMGASSAFAQTGDSRPDARESQAAATPRRQPSGASPALSDTALKYGYVSFNVGYQGTTSSFSNTWSYASNLETAAVTAAYSVKPALLVDGGGGVRVWRGLTLGVAVSRYRRSDDAGIAASVPHPFFYNTARTYQGTTGGPQRTETAAHVQAMWTARVARRVQLSVFGGPSYFDVEQVFLSSVNFAQAYPYDSITFANAPTQARSASKIGFNVGADFTYLLYRQIGVGAMVRFSGANVPFTAPDGTAMSLKAGGVQGGAGLRVRF